MVVAAVVVGKKAELHFIDAASGEVRERIATTQNWFSSWFYFTADGKRLVLSSLNEAKIEVFECPSGKLLHILSEGTDAPKAKAGGGGRPKRFDLRNIILSPDGRLLASYADAKTMVIWDMTTGRRLGTLTQPGRRAGPKPKYDSDSRPFQSSGPFSPDRALPCL